MITGGTGSLGNELVKIFLNEFSLSRLVVFSRDELKQSIMAKRYFNYDKKKILRFFLGDVRDIDRLKFAMKNIHYVHMMKTYLIKSFQHFIPFKVLKKFKLMKLKQVI